ncbi:MAG TPA: hypothetical protein VF752_16250 [Thermoleophilaceae bacterium]
MADRDQAKSGGVSLDTIIVASLASVTAMLITSHFWKGGTVISAAMTPVIVALASEAYRRPARKVTQLAPAVKRLAPVAESRQPARGRARGGTLTASRPQQRTFERNGGSSSGNGGGVTIYRPRRNLHVKAAIATGLVAFVIGALVLTVPELVFGGSVTTGSRTTLFGGGHSSASRDRQKTTTQPEQTQPQQNPQSSPTPTTPAEPPAQTAPAQPPAQTAPAPQATPPPSNGGSAPPAQSAPTP